MAKKKISRNREYEFQVGEYFESLGYKAEVTRESSDWGVDCFIEKDGLRYAVQAKNYGGCKTKISRKDVMELYGAMAYFDCQGAKFVYNGDMKEDAKIVADKLGIECIYLDYKRSAIPVEDMSGFDACWEDVVKPLSGKTLESISGKTSYTVTEVTDSYIKFVNGNGKPNRIKKDILKWTYNRAISTGEIRGKEIRDEFHTVFSSFVVAVFMQIPSFVVERGPVISPRRD